MFLIFLLFLICRGISCLDLLIVDWCSWNVALLLVTAERGPLGRLQCALQRCRRKPKHEAEWMRVGGCGAAVTCNWCVDIWPRCRIRWHWQAVTDWVGSDSDCHYKRSCSARTFRKYQAVRCLNSEVLLMNGPCHILNSKKLSVQLRPVCGDSASTFYEF